MKKYSKYLMAFLLPIIILIIYIISVNGNLNSLFISDLREQYLFLFDYLKQVLNGEKSFFYSYSVGLGQGMIGTYAYYLASPLNLLLFFVPEIYLMNFISILILMKIGLSGLNMFIYLEKSNNNEYYINIMFSLCYALMSFNLMYYFNIMWLDAIYLTPLIILGIDKLILENKSNLYIITLFICIISQYYMGFIVCIFCVIYFIYKALICNKCNKRVLKSFVTYSLIAGFLTAFLTLPTLIDLFNIYREDSISQLSFLQKLSNLLVSLGIKKSVNSMDFRFPNIYCGLINIVLCINFLLYAKDKKKKAVTSIILLFFAVSILLEPLIILWHAGSSPFGILYRFSFLISLFLIIISADYYKSYNVFNNRTAFILVSIYTLLLLLGYTLQSESEINYIIIFVNAMILLGNIILLNINFLNGSKFTKIGIILFVVIELIINLKYSLTINESLKENQKSILDNNRFELYDSINDIENNTVRIDGKPLYYEDEQILIDKGNINLFLSSNNKQMFSFLNDSGYYVISPSASINTNNYFLNSLLGIKYWYGDNVNDEIYEYYYTINLNDKKIPIYKNKYALSLGYIVNDNEFIYNYNNPFEYQNSFVKAISNNTIFDKYDYESINGREYILNLNESNNIYLYIPISAENYSNLFVNIYINDELVKFQANVLEEIIVIPNNYKNQKVKVKIEYLEDIEFLPTILFYYDDYEKNINILKNLQEQQLENIEINKNKLVGNINVKNEQMTLMVTIPYDSGFEVRVDGKKTEYSKLYDSFIGIKLSKGKHKIEMVYKPRGLKSGLIISVITLLIYLTYLRRRKNDKETN